jgi:hypothetical protein
MSVKLTDDLVALGHRSVEVRERLRWDLKVPPPIHLARYANKGNPDATSRALAIPQATTLDLTAGEAPKHLQGGLPDCARHLQRGGAHAARRE